MIFPEYIPSNAHWKRIHVIFARSTYKAVIFVCGPSDWTKQIVWYIETSEFIHGQSLRGKLYLERSDLSPSGDYLIYFVGKYYHKDPQYQRFTAVCRPPDFTAVTLWPAQTSWYGGGFFIDEQTICLYHQTDLQTTHVQHPNRIFNIVRYTQDLLSYHPNIIAGWKEVANTPAHLWSLERIHLHLPYQLIVQFPRNNIFAPDARKYYLTNLTDNDSTHLSGVYWADFDQNGYLIMARYGQLLRCDLSKIPLHALLVIDLNHNNSQVEDKTFT